MHLDNLPGAVAARQQAAQKQKLELGPDVEFGSATILPQVSDGERYATWFRELLDRGVYIAPSQYEAMFVSGAHTVADIDATVTAAAEAFAAVAAG